MSRNDPSSTPTDLDMNETEVAKLRGDMNTEVDKLKAELAKLRQEMQDGFTNLQKLIEDQGLDGYARATSDAKGKHGPVESAALPPTATKLPLIFFRMSPSTEVDKITELTFSTIWHQLQPGAKVSEYKQGMMERAGQEARAKSYRQDHHITRILLFLIDSEFGRGRLLTDDDVILTHSSILLRGADITKPAAAAERYLPPDLFKLICDALPKTPGIVQEEGVVSIRGLACGCTFEKTPEEDNPE